METPVLEPPNTSAGTETKPARNRIIGVLIVLAALIGAGAFWMKGGGPAKPAEEKPPAEEARVKRDDNGQVVIKMDDEAQGNMGLLVTKPEAGQLSPELKSYGRVLDPTPLAALLTELASVRAASTASSNEYARLKVLAGQGNASERALQTAEATALHDQLAIQSARERLALSWGKVVAARSDLAAFVQELASQDAVLVRLDLPAGEELKAPPLGARVFNLSGSSAEAEYLGSASTVDPQMLGRGSIFRIKPNALRLLPGEAVTGFIKILGEPIHGLIIPNNAVVRTEGAGWVYVLESGGDSFTRIGIALDHPLETGWFITKGVTTNQYVVTTGAQTLLSEELKASIKAD